MNKDDKAEAFSIFFDDGRCDFSDGFKGSGGVFGSNIPAVFSYAMGPPSWVPLKKRLAKIQIAYRGLLCGHSCSYLPAT